MTDLFHRLAWIEGMFLGPQHFQQVDRRWRAEAAARLRLARSYAHGVIRLRFDTEALGSSRLQLKELSAVWPDGDLVQAPGVDELPPSRNLKELFAADAQRQVVYLACPEVRPGVTQCRLPEQTTAAESPFRGEAVTVEDEIQPGQQREIMVARRNLRLLLDSESRDGFLTVPVAAIVRDADGRFTLAAEFAPPSLTAGACGPLPAILQGLVELLAAKSAALTEQTRQRSGGVVEFGASDAGNFWLLNTVNTYLPMVAHLQQCLDEHPATAYRVLVMLNGALTTFSTEQQARDLPAYDHLAPGPVFCDLERGIRLLLETVTPTRYRTVVLIPKSEALLAADLTDPRLVEGRPQFYLAVSGDIPEHTIRDDVPGQVIVGSPHNIDFLVQTATPGVALVHVPMPPRDFPLKAGRTYFRLETSGETWPTVLEARAIAVYIGGARLRTCRFELVATQA
ncbi:MAG: type VI secretion system baseplate subunit TssK [Candidatus Krumholzibacteria bacterium]|jgi:type VI secretion system protein ImpJ|nr:type VI secretion system baseplate subunit TssK [Candidatus Krumholzibacteria bacterium]